MEDKFKAMKETLMSTVASQLGRLDKVDAKELGEVVDMIKDLEEASYYCSVVKAMDKKEEEENQPRMYYTQMYPPYRPEGYEDYWRDMDKMAYDRMYYTQPRNSQGQFTETGNGGRRNYDGGGSGSSGGNSSSSGGQGGSSGMRGYYTETRFPMEWRDEREGRSPRTRKMYMESKAMHQDQAIKIQELEKYMKELSEDIVDMIKDASPEEQKTLKIKLNELANKLT